MATKELLQVHELFGELELVSLGASGLHTVLFLVFYFEHVHDEFDWVLLDFAF
jgi:hypothetical protein